jgi:hypothetical protein
MTAFTDHVKKIASEQKISYREAMKLAKETYIKPIKIEKVEEVKEEVSPVVEDVKTVPEPLEIVSLTEKHFEPIPHEIKIVKMPKAEKLPRKKKVNLA